MVPKAELRRLGEHRGPGLHQRAFTEQVEALTQAGVTVQAVEGRGCDLAAQALSSHVFGQFWFNLSHS